MNAALRLSRESTITRKSIPSKLKDKHAASWAKTAGRSIDHSVPIGGSSQPIALLTILVSAGRGQSLQIFPFLARDILRHLYETETQRRHDRSGHGRWRCCPDLARECGFDPASAGRPNRNREDRRPRRSPGSRFTLARLCVDG